MYTLTLANLVINYRVGFEHQEGGKMFNLIRVSEEPNPLLPFFCGGGGDGDSDDSSSSRDSDDSDDDGSDHGDYSEGSDADSSDTDSGSEHSDNDK